MKLPGLQGIVRRRILVNFRVDPDVIQRELPAPFRPRIVGGWAVAGVCLIRLEQLRPGGFPALLGLSSENAAHRVAVTWRDHAGQEREAVYIPRRDTGSPLNALFGGRLFPGEQRRARFCVREDAGTLDLALRTWDGAGDVRLKVHPTDRLPTSSVFKSMAEASQFFQGGSVGYSATSQGPRLDGLELHTREWRLEPLDVEAVSCSYFAAGVRFPAGSVEFDSALVMRDIPHEWRAIAGLTASEQDPIPSPALGTSATPSNGAAI